MPSFPLPNPDPRERQIWRTLWRTPQAAMWNLERHRMHAVGHYTRLLYRAEQPDSTAALLGQLHRFADQLGLTPRGLAENGWRLPTDADTTPPPPPPPRRRLATSPTKPAPIRRLRTPPSVLDLTATEPPHTTEDETESD